MLNITEMAKEIHELTAWQETPETLEEKDYINIVIRAVKKYFTDINRPEEYSSELWITDDDGTRYLNRDLLLDEEEYIKILCRIEFFQRVQSDVNTMVGYTTNAITVTSANKPYDNLQQTLNDLQYERRIAFNKMVRYTLGET